MINSKNFIIFLLLSICFAANLEAQNKKQVENDINLYARFLNTNLDSSYYHINIAYQKSLVLKNDSLIARTTFNMSNYFYLTENYEASSKYVNTAIKYAEKVKFSRVLSLAYNQLGKIYVKKRNQNDKALQYFLKAYDISLKNKLYDCQSSVLINLGNLYLLQTDTTKSLKYYDENIKNAKTNGLKKELLIGYMNTAIIRSKRNPKVAIAYYNKAIVLAKETNDLYSEFNLQINLAGLYENNEALKAFFHLQEAQRIQKQLGDQSILFYLNFNLGGYYKKQGKLNEAIIYYNKALEDVKNQEVPKDQLLAIYDVLSETYHYRKDYKNALLYLEKKSVLSDSLFTIKKNKSFDEIQTKYEVEKKNLRFDLLNKEKIIADNKNKNSIYIFTILIIAIIAIVLSFKSRIRNQKRLQGIQKKIYLQDRENLRQEQELKRITDVIEGQDKERNRIAEEIHDAVGGRLAGIKLNLTRINYDLKNPNLEIIIDKLSGVFQELRSISHNLSINKIKDEGFRDLLSDLKNEYESGNEFKIEIVMFSDTNFEHITMELKQQFYRIIQELLTNVSKYAKAKTVTITITHSQNFMTIIVEDDGCGFETTNSKGIGLKNICNRISSINGKFVIDSKIGRGSTFIIEVGNIK